METINDRIAICVRESGLTKTDFAEKIKVSQAYVSALCAGKYNPSERIIANICREFEINEKWLKYGEEPKKIELSRKDELERFVKDTLKDDSSFRCKLISVLARMSQEEWELLERKAWELIEETTGAVKLKKVQPAKQQPHTPTIEEQALAEAEKYKNEVLFPQILAEKVAQAGASSEFSEGKNGVGIAT